MEIEFTENKSIGKLYGIRRSIWIVLTLCCIMASTVCFIADYGIHKEVTWSLIVLESILFGWCVILPMLTARRQIVAKTLSVVSIATIPYLYLLSTNLNNKMISQMGTKITAVSLVGLWMIYIIGLKLKNRVFGTMACAMIILESLSLVIQMIVSQFIHQNILRFPEFIEMVCIIGLSVVFLFVDFLQKERIKVKKVNTNL